MSQTHLGGTFAPPLTDEKLASYRETVEAMPPSAVKDALVYLLPCCEKWWELPESNGHKSQHPMVSYTVVNKDGDDETVPAPVMQGLQPDHAAALDDHIPWPYEMDSLEQLFLTVEREQHDANSVKVQAWMISVVNHVVATDFPEDPTLYSRMAEATKHGTDWVDLLSDAEQDRINAILERCWVCLKKIKVALSHKVYAPIPRPALAPTPIRDMAMHLLWHVKELEKGREPITTDKL